MDKEAFLKQYTVNRKQTNSVKWDNLKEKFGATDLIPLWVADTEFKMPKAAQQALQKRIEHGAFGYSLTPADYYENYFNWQKQRYGIELKQDWLRFGNGVVEALSTCVQFLTRPNDAVMVLQPVYYPFMNVVEKNERQLVVSKLINENGAYRMDLAEITKKIQQYHVKLLILCSPHNPVGRVWQETELEALFEVCCQEKVLVISDEIHHDLIVDQNSKFVSALEIKAGLYRDNLIVLDAPSKTFNLAGLTFSQLIIPNPQLRARYDEIVARLACPSGNILGKIAGSAAYSQGQDWLEGLLDLLRANYAMLKQTLAAYDQRIVLSPLQGTYLAWVDLSALVKSADLEALIIKQAKLAVDFGDWFGQGGSGHIRLNLATTPEILKQALSQLTSALDTYQNENK